MSKIVSVAAVVIGALVGALPLTSRAVEACPLLEQMPEGEPRRDCKYPCAPLYPRRAYRDGLEGDVVLDVTVAASGKPARVHIDTPSAHDVLNKAALRVTKESVFPRYLPKGKAGGAICYRILHPVQFRIEPEEVAE